MLEENLRKIQETLQKYGQEQLLANYDKLDEQKKKTLLEEIKTIDFAQMEELYKNVGKTMESEDVKIDPIPYIDKAKIEDKERNIYFEKGANEIRNGKLAIVTMAGGQGTRLRT